MNASVVLALCAFSPLFQIQKYEAASADVVETEKARVATGHVDYKVDRNFDIVYDDLHIDDSFDSSGENDDTKIKDKTKKKQTGDDTKVLTKE